MINIEAERRSAQAYPFMVPAYPVADDLMTGRDRRHVCGFYSGIATVTSIVLGPFVVVATQVFRAAQVVSMALAAGLTRGGAYLAGAAAADDYEAGKRKAQIHIAKRQIGQIAQATTKAVQAFMASSAAVTTNTPNHIEKAAVFTAGDEAIESAGGRASKSEAHVATAIAAEVS